MTPSTPSPSPSPRPFKVRSICEDGVVRYVADDRRGNILFRACTQTDAQMICDALNAPDVDVALVDREADVFSLICRAQEAVLLLRQSGGYNETRKMVCDDIENVVRSLRSSQPQAAKRDDGWVKKCAEELATLQCAGYSNTVNAMETILMRHLSKLNRPAKQNDKGE